MHAFALRKQYSLPHYLTRCVNTNFQKYRLTRNVDVPSMRAGLEVIPYRLLGATLNIFILFSYLHNGLPKKVARFSPTFPHKYMLCSPVRNLIMVRESYGGRLGRIAWIGMDE